MSTRTIIKTAFASVAVLVAVAPQVGSGCEGERRFDHTTITISNEVRGVDIDTITSPWGDTITFVKVDASQNADIVVSYAEMFDRKTTGSEANTYDDNEDGWIDRCYLNVKHDKIDNTLLTHEMGHCLGLGHDRDSDSTNMYPNAKWYQQGWSDIVTDADRTNLESLYKNGSTS